MIRALLVAAGALLILSAPAAAAGLERVRMASGKTVEALPGQVIVRYREDGINAGKARLAALGATSRGRIQAINAELVSVPAGQTVTSFIETLKSNPNVLSAEPNGIVRAFAFPEDAPNDPLYPSLYALSKTAAANVNIYPAWALSLGDPSVIVAVLDTGVDLDNADFDGGSFVQGRRIEIDWFNDGDCTDTPVSDPELSTVGPDQCEGDNPEDDNNLPTVIYHGTRVSGIIAASANNGTAITGVAPNVKIMGVKVLNSYGGGSFFSISQGITWAADNGADVINLSLGGPDADPSGATQAAIDYALSKNVVVVAAAGNDGNSSDVSFPAAYTGVIAVGSIGASNALSIFSQTGKTLDLVAPGEDIFSTVPSTVTASSKNGTSFSSPYVAGAAALIRSVRPDLSWREVAKYINFTATDLGSGGFDTGFGFGRLNIGRAVVAAANNEIFVSNPADPGETFPYPNPFRPASGQTVTISLPASMGSDGIEIDILNVAGEKIKTLSGTTVWDGRNEDGSYAASGLYFYRAKTSSGDAKGKLTLIK